MYRAGKGDFFLVPNKRYCQRKLHTAHAQKKWQDSWTVTKEAQSYMPTQEANQRGQPPIVLYHNLLGKKQ